MFSFRRVIAASILFSALISSATVYAEQCTEGVNAILTQKGSPLASFGVKSAANWKKVQGYSVNQNTSGCSKNNPCVVLWEKTVPSPKWGHVAIIYDCNGTSCTMQDSNGYCGRDRSVCPKPFNISSPGNYYVVHGISSGSSSPAPTLVYGSSFVRDVTIPDGYRARKGEKLGKQWELRNSGTARWDNVKVVPADALSAQLAVSSPLVPSVSPGQSAVVNLSLLAPSKSGQYKGSYRLSGPNGPFGTPFYVLFSVQ